jgi:hypothetical protein
MGVSSPRRFLYTFAGVFATFAILVFAVVTATDPARYFFGSPVPQIWPDTPHVKVDLFRTYGAREKVTGLLMGSSRCAGLLPEQADRLTGLRFFNASVYDASTDHYLAMYRLFRKVQSAAPKMLVLGIDTVLLSSAAGVSEDLTANYPLSSQLDGTLTRPWHFARLYANYLRAQTFFDLKTSISNWIHPKPPLYGFSPDGYDGEQLGQALPQHVDFEALVQGGDSFAERYFEFKAISELRVERLRLLLDEASADGVHVLLWITPVHPALRAAIDHLPAVTATEWHAREIIGEMASRYHARLVDLSLPESFGGDPSTWRDLVHVSTADARRELDRVLIKTDDR